MKEEHICAAAPGLGKVWVVLSDYRVFFFSSVFRDYVYLFYQEKKSWNNMNNQIELGQKSCVKRYLFSFVSGIGNT